MSDKKERILIISGSYEDIESLAYRFPWTDLDKIHVEEYSRNEAIKEMAGAMETPYFNDIHASEPDMLEALAEAALDALVDK